MNRFRHTVTERSNLAMAMDNASREPTYISFFQNEAILIRAEEFIGLTDHEFHKLQEDLRDKVCRSLDGRPVLRPPMHENAAHARLNAPRPVTTGTLA